MTASAPSRPHRPLPGKSRPYHFPHFERRVLDNGLRVVVAPVSKLPLVTVVALVDAGAVCDLRDREGVAQLTAKLLLEGTSRFEGAQLTEQFELLGASVEARADWDAAAISLTVLADRLERSIALLGDVVRDPAFPEREV